MTTHIYDAKKVIVTIAGIPIGGFGEGDIVEIDDKEDRYSIKTGADGKDSTFVKSNDEQATIKITLMENSSSVATINSATKLAELLGKPFPIGVKNINSNRSHDAASCMLQKKPSEKYGKEVPQLEYVFCTPKVSSDKIDLISTVVGAAANIISNLI